MKVRQLINNNGNPAANQFVIDNGNTSYFQSYQSVVAKIEKGKVSLSNRWDYSRTTAKHLYIFLAEYGYWHLCSAAAMRKAISNGEVTLVNTPSL